MKLTHRSLTPHSLLAASVLCASTIACGEEAPPPTYPVTFLATADPGEPLAGVQIVTNGTPTGLTGADGTLRVELSGAEGSTVGVTATCPAGHRDADPIPSLILRRVIDLATSGTAALQVSITCRPINRHGVVIVRAGGDGPREGIPVLIDGREVTRTDRSGVAHVALDMAPGAGFQVMLSTATVAPMLRPSNPAMPFTFPDHDEVFVFDRPFDTEAPPPPPRRARRRRAAPEPARPVSIPTRLGGRR